MTNLEIIDLCGRLWLFNILISGILMYLTMAKDSLYGSAKYKLLDGLYYRSLSTLPFTFSLLFFAEYIIPKLYQ